MKSRYIALIACIGIIAIGLGWVFLLQANFAASGNGTPTTQALAIAPPTVTLAASPTAPPSPTWSATATDVTFTATALPSDMATTLSSDSGLALPIVTQEPGFPVPTQTGPYIFQGSYFAVQVPAGWGAPNGSAFDSSYEELIFPSLEEREWPINTAAEIYVDIRALYEPYDELIRSSAYSAVEPFHAGNLRGISWTYTYTDIKPSQLYVILPGTDGNTGPICYEAWLEMPTTLTQTQHDKVVQQFKETMASLVPTQLALQSTPTAITAPAGVQACAVTSLAAKTDGQGCTGFFCGSLTLTNIGQTACTVSGKPTALFTDSHGKALSVGQTSLPPALGNADSVVVLRPGEAAWTSFRYGSTCGRKDQVDDTFTIELPGWSGPLPTTGPFGPGVCVGGDGGSGIEIGTFKPLK